MHRVVGAASCITIGGICSGASSSSCSGKSRWFATGASSVGNVCDESRQWYHCLPQWRSVYELDRRGRDGKLEQDSIRPLWLEQQTAVPYRN
jgi:hypothetical protein